jgi:hypothetical protein
LIEKAARSVWAPHDDDALFMMLEGAANSSEGVYFG